MKHSFPRLALLALLTLSAASVSQAATITDDFADGDDTGWSRFDPFAAFGSPADFSFPGGKYRIAAVPSPNSSVLGPSRAGSTLAPANFANSIVAVDVSNWGTGNDQAFGLTARLTNIGLGTTDGYAMTYSVGSQEITITRIDDEATVNLAQSPVTFVAGQSYRLTFELDGSQLKGRAYASSDLVNPLAVVTLTDATYASGMPGMVVFDNTNREVASFGAVASFDNFAATSIPEPGGCVVVGMAVAAIAKRRRRH